MKTLNTDIMPVFWEINVQGITKQWLRKQRAIFQVIKKFNCIEAKPLTFNIAWEAQNLLSKAYCKQQLSDVSKRSLTPILFIQGLGKAPWFTYWHVWMHKNKMFCEILIQCTHCHRMKSCNNHLPITVISFISFNFYVQYLRHILHYITYIFWTCYTYLIQILDCKLMVCLWTHIPTVLEECLCPYQSEWWSTSQSFLVNQRLQTCLTWFALACIRAHAIPNHN